MKQKLTWWIEGQPFNNTFSTLTEVIDDIKKIVKENEDFDFNKKIFMINAARKPTTLVVGRNLYNLEKDELKTLCL